LTIGLGFGLGGDLSAELVANVDFGAEVRAVPHDFVDLAPEFDTGDFLLAVDEISLPPGDGLIGAYGLGDRA